MAIQSPGFNVAPLDPASLITGRSVDATPFGLDFDQFMSLLQRLGMDEAGETAATGGATTKSDSPIMDAILGTST